MKGVGGGGYLDKVELVPEVTRIISLDELIDSACRIGHLAAEREDLVFVKEAVGGDVGQGSHDNGEADEEKDTHHSHLMFLYRWTQRLAWGESE